MPFLVPDLIRILHFPGKRRDLTVEEYLSDEQTGKELIVNIQVPLDNKVIHKDQYIAKHYNFSKQPTPGLNQELFCSKFFLS